MKQRITAASIAAAVCAGAIIQCAGRPATGAPEQSPLVFKGKAPLAAGMPPVHVPQPYRLTLPNGLRIFVHEDHRLPHIEYSIIVPAGSLIEGMPGLADMTAGMLTQGTKSRSAEQMDAQTDQIGAYLYTHVYPEYTEITGGGLSEESDKLIGLMCDTLLHPAFPEKRLNVLKRRKIADFRQTAGRLSSVINHASGQIFYGLTPYADPQPGQDDIAAITQADVAAFHDQGYAPNGAYLSITGDVDRKAVVATFRKALMSWKAGSADLKPEQWLFTAPPARRIYLADWPADTSATLSFQCLTVPWTNPDYLPLLVMSKVVGAPTARLDQDLRETQGLVYGAASTLEAQRWPAVWKSEVTVRAEDTAKTMESTLRQLKRLEDEPVPVDEMNRGKRDVLGEFALTLERPETDVEQAIVLERSHLPRHYWDTYADRVAAVTPADIQRVARKYLGNHLQIIAVGPRAKLETVLQDFGPLVYLDQLGGRQ